MTSLISITTLILKANNNIFLEVRDEEKK